MSKKWLVTYGYDPTARQTSEVIEADEYKVHRGTTDTPTVPLPPIVTFLQGMATVGTYWNVTAVRQVHSLNLEEAKKELAVVMNNTSPDVSKSSIDAFTAVVTRSNKQSAPYPRPVVKP